MAEVRFKSPSCTYVSTELESAKGKWEDDDEPSFMQHPWQRYLMSFHKQAETCLLSFLVGEGYF